MFQWLNYSCKAQSTFCNRVLVKQNSIVSLHILGFFDTPIPQLQKKLYQHSTYDFSTIYRSCQIIKCLSISLFVVRSICMIYFWISCFHTGLAKQFKWIIFMQFLAKKPLHFIDTSNVIGYLSNYSFLLIFKLLIS